MAKLLEPFSAQKIQELDLQKKKLIKERDENIRKLLAIGVYYIQQSKISIDEAYNKIPKIEVKK